LKTGDEDRLVRAATAFVGLVPLATFASPASSLSSPVIVTKPLNFRHVAKVCVQRTVSSLCECEMAIRFSSNKEEIIEQRSLTEGAKVLSYRARLNVRTDLRCGAY
jgi:hypothetical protein